MLYHPNDSGPLPTLGGNGRQLLHLQQLGHPVPPWIALPAEVFQQILEQNDLPDWIADQLAAFTPENAASIAEAIQARIRKLPFPSELIQALSNEPLLKHPVAVRSSAADEDGSHHSFAGIHESYLNQRGLEAIQARIRDVWASAYQERALQYRHRHGLPLHPVAMAVLIQQQIDAAISGVAFTADPASGNPHVLLISSLYGLGEGLVGRGFPADLHRIDKQTRDITPEPVGKPTQLRYHETDGIAERPVPAEQQAAPALTGADLRRLIPLLLSLESACGHPQDVEFCLDTDRNLFLLQTRNITTVTDRGPAAGFRQIWDNANIIESYSGVTSPMTFSFIRHAYTVVYHCFSRVMGIPAKTVTANREVYENMLGLIHGRVYYNLVNWYRLIRQFPGYGMNKRYMESMMGLRDRFDPEYEAPPPSAWRRWTVEAPKLFWLLLRMCAQFARLDRGVTRFQSRFKDCYTRWEALDFRAMRPHELMAVYREMETRLLWNWRAPIVNDFYVMIHYGLLRGLCRRWCGDEAGTLQNDLICGNGDIESTEPTRMLMRMALEIRNHPAWHETFQTLTHHQLADRVPRDSEFASLQTQMQIFLDRYGFRCINELKLEEPSLRETPEFVYQILQNYLRIDPELLDTDAMAAREAAIRATAETRAETALREGSFVWLRRPVFRHVLRAARKGVRNRENMRFARTRIYGVLRELLQAMGHHLHQAGQLDDPHHVFDLTIDELWDFVKGTAVTTDLKALTALRRAEFNAWREEPEPPADHFETFGMVCTGNSCRNWQSATAAEGDLQGTGCCPGRITAPVRIVHSPREEIDLHGRILVAGRTDPGWVPLYPAAVGLLIERGSILSHSAIVAREMGLPAIVGIPNLLSTLTDGQTVTMDGATGQITVE
ncbi:MAG: PEP/pyruvate-binding domain-containing protein [Actinomycetota bacterium]